MFHRRHLLKILGSGCASTLLGACSSRVSAAQAGLVVAAYPSVDKIAQAAAPEWAVQHPSVPVHVISRQFSDHHTAMMTALATGAYLPDVMAIEVGFLGRFARGGGLQNLADPAFGITRYRSAFTPYAYDQALQNDGHMIAAPSDIGPGTLLYRKDLLQASDVSVAQMQQSWEGFLQCGKAIRERTGARLVPNALDVLNIVIRSGLAPGDGLYFDANGHPALQSPRFQQGFELATRVRQLGLDARVQAWSTDWASGIRNGEIATLLSGAWLAGHLSNWLAPKSGGLWRAGQLPAGAWVAYGGTFLAIPRQISPQRKALAWQFIRMMTLNGGRQLAAFEAVDAFPSLVQTYRNPFFDAPIAFLGGERARELWRRAALNIRAVAVNPQDAFASEVVSTALFNVMEEGQAIPVALRKAQDLLQRRVGQI